MEELELQEMASSPEDIVLCVDVDSQLDSELKITSSKGQPLTRLDAVKQALWLFVHSKIAISGKHRFAIATIGQLASWHLHQFLGDYDALSNSIRSLRSEGSYQTCDLYSLFQLVAEDAIASKKLGRSFRVILIYCRSDVVPSLRAHTFDNQKHFTFDALYLHDKPNASNCPQQVYDILVEILERVCPQGYIYESGSGFSRVLFRHVCQLLAHPQQRGLQDESLPKVLSRPVATDGTQDSIVLTS